MKRQKIRKNGFTLIELLAVIIILGILMIIAIPSVTSYISNSRKSAYVDTAREIIMGARNIVNSGKYEMFDTDTTYYLPVSCINTENGLKSPYGDFDKAYVLVLYDGKSYNYYWTSVDEAGQGIKNIVKYDNLTEDEIESDIKSSDINVDTVIGKRKKIKALDENCNFKDETATLKVPLNGGERYDVNEACYVNPSVRIVSDRTSSTKVGDEVHLTSQISGFDRCTLTYYWQFKGDITNNEWANVSDYNFDWIKDNTLENLTFIIDYDNALYSWRLALYD